MWVAVCAFWGRGCLPWAVFCDDLQGDRFMDFRWVDVGVGVFVGPGRWSDWN